LNWKIILVLFKDILKRNVSKEFKEMFSKRDLKEVSSVFPISVTGK